MVLFILFITVEDLRHMASLIPFAPQCLGSRWGDKEPIRRLKETGPSRVHHVPRPLKLGYRYDTWASGHSM